MIHLKLKITWPLAILILVAVLAWLARSRSTSATKRPAKPAEQSPARPATSRPSVETFIIFPGDAEGRPAAASEPPAPEAHPDDDDNAPEITYAEALRAPHGTYTEEQLASIGDREAARAGRHAFRQAATDCQTTDSINRLRNWRPRDRH